MRHILAILSVLVLWALFAGILSGRVHAQQPALEVALARVCVAESGWNAHNTGECAAIYGVVKSRAAARRVSAERALFDYAAKHFDASRSSRPWVAGLDARGDRPAHWPTRIDWRRYRERWLITLAHARKVLTGEVVSPCEGRVDHWGGAMDDARARRAGLERVACAEGIRNHFWRRPRRTRSAS